MMVKKYKDLSVRNNGIEIDKQINDKRYRGSRSANNTERRKKNNWMINPITTYEMDIGARFNSNTRAVINEPRLTKTK